MQKPPCKKITDFLPQLGAKLQRLAQLNCELDHILDSPLRSYCQVANVVDQRLILLVANASIATNLRFQKDIILAKMQKIRAFKYIQDIQIKVRPHYSSLEPLAPLKKSMERLSAETATIVNDCAETITDAKLKTIMKRIASRTKISD